jgi:hypothetical protein
MTTPQEFDRQLRAMAHRAQQEMSTTPRVERRALTPRRRIHAAPLALALGVAAAIAIAAPLLAGRHLRGGTAGPQPPEATKPAAAILHDMTDAMSHLRTYHMVIHGVATDGTTPVTIELLSDRTGAVSETTTVGSRTNALIYTHGALYLKGPDVVPPGMQAATGSHWLGMRAPDLGNMISTFASPGHLIDCFTGAPGALTTDGVHIVNDIRAIRVVSTQTSADTTSYTVDIAVGGVPYALHIEDSAGGSDRPGCQASAGLQNSDLGVTGFPAHERIDFDEFNSAVLVAAPNPLDVVDAAVIASPTP